MSVHTSPEAERALAGALAAHCNGENADHLLSMVDTGDLTDRAALAVFDAANELRDNGSDLSVLTLTERVRAAGRLGDVGGPNGVDHLVAEAASISTMVQIARDVRNLARWRRRTRVAAALQDSAVLADQDEWDRAEAQLSGVDAATSHGGMISPHELTETLMESVKPGKSSPRWPWPLPTLQRLTGGARQGQVTFIGGPSSHGKSAFLDCAMQSMCEAGAKGMLFLNEMTAAERAERIAANIANVKYSRIQAASAGTGGLLDNEVKQMVDKMAAQPVSMVECADWPIDRILRTARRHKPDVMALDIVQKLPTRPFDKRLVMLEDAVQRVDAFAKDTGCHVLLVGQVNRARADGVFPLPGLADVKDCAELVNGPDNVLFVWRKQDKKTLEMQAEGIIRIAKYRGAKLEPVEAAFNGEHQRWLEVPTQFKAAA